MTEPYKIGAILVVEVFLEDSAYYGTWVGVVIDYYRGTRGEMFYSFEWILSQCKYNDQTDFKESRVYEGSGARLHCKEPL